MSIKTNSKLDKSYVLLTVMGLLLGYYAGFLFSSQVMTFLYNFMPMMEIRLIPTTIYSNFICMVLGAYLSCALYCILRKSGIKRQLFAVSAAFTFVRTAPGLRLLLRAHHRNQPALGYSHRILRAPNKKE